MWGARRRKRQSRTIKTHSTERALRVAEHLQLPKLLAHSLNTKAALRLRGDRVREASALYRTVIEISEEHELLDSLTAGYADLGALSKQWDLPGAEAALERALELSRRHGNRDMEGFALADLGFIRLVQGRWDEVAEMAELFLDPERPRIEDGNLWYLLALLHARRGEHDQARHAVERLSAWRESDDLEQRTTYAAVTLVAALAGGHPGPGLAAAIAAQSEAVAGHGGGAGAVRIGWADTVRGAIELGRLDDARSLIALLAELPAGRIPPFIRAHLALARASLALAQGGDRDLEANLQSAINGFAELGYPYDLALAQTELAGWLSAQNRAEEAEPPLTDAIATYTSLHAVPDLKRARALLPGAAERTPLEV